MAMLGAAVHLGIRIEVASIDHGLRSESASEIELVRRFAASCSVPFVSQKLALDPTRPGLEAEARSERYLALKRLALERQLPFIATAHTMDDQAETVLMRLLRGSALRGARGVLLHRADGVVRPLLFARRHETESFVTRNGIPSIRDPMNADRRFLRVRVRQDLMGVLESIGGAGSIEAVSRFANYAQEDDSLLETLADRAFFRVRVESGLDWMAVQALERPLRRRVFAKWLSEHRFPIDARLLEEVLVAASERRVATLPFDCNMLLKEGVLTVSAAPARLHRTSSSDGGRAAG
jgi:tRNA(Ile)-lysidine synthase